MNDTENMIPYLSDEDLGKLISDTENEALAMAPSYIEDKVLSVIKIREQRKIISFRQYCARVSVAVAVAILFVCTVPFVPDLRTAVSLPEYDASESPLISREDVLFTGTVKTKTEVLDEMNAPGYLEKAEISIRSQIDNILN
ncbi:MAG TPA: hypothetical protein DCG85_06965 [Lachnospiraceae bacterium]|nr:hypothetical protein [Lachnospiraceae bacterium]